MTRGSGGFDEVGVHTVVERTAARLPDAVALRFGDRQWSFRELDALADAFAALLEARGIEPGDRVAIMTSTRPEFPALVLGILKRGAAAVMVSPAWKQTEVRHALDLTRPALAVCDRTTREVLEGLFDAARLLDLDRDEADVDSLTSSFRPQRSRISDLDWAGSEAVLVFSSGTTGMPKAVRHTHASFGQAMAHWIGALGLGADDRLQVTTPPVHILGLLNLLVAAATGASVRLHERFDLEAMLRGIESDGVTIEMAVAPIALALADHPDLEHYDLSSLRYIVWGATPVTESVARRVTERAGVAFLPGYGASEVPVIAVNPVERPEAWRLDTVGLPVPGLSLRIADLETGAPVAPGATGEIQVRSPSAMAGYLPADANADAFVDGWFRTGDVGWVEPEGWLHITDRVKEMIKVQGFQVAPAEVEAVLHGHPSVADCAVFGVPDARTGEAVCAAVALHAGASAGADELIARVASELARYKGLRAVHFVEEIPRLPSGKVLRRVLRERFAGA